MSGKLALLFSGHALRRMVLRAVTELHVSEVLKANDVIESYPDDTPYPSALPDRVVPCDDVENPTCHQTDVERMIVVTV